MGKHVAPRSPLRRTPRAVLTATAALAGAVVLGIAGAGGTYALWNHSAPLDGGTVNSGSTGLAVNGTTTYTIQGLDFTKLLPGRSVITSSPLAVKNTGTPPLNVTPAAAVKSGALAPQIVVAIRQVAGAASACTPTAVGGTPSTITAPFRINPGQTAYVCVEVQLSSSAPSTVQGQTGGFTIPLNAVQVRP